MGFKLEVKEEVVIKEDEILVRVNGIARLAPKLKAQREAKK